MTVLHFNDIAAQNVELTGGKGASLAKLTAFGFRVPRGFVVTADSYRAFIAQVPWLAETLVHLRFDEPEILANQAVTIQEGLRALPFPAEAEAQLRSHYTEHFLANGASGADASVSVRSSATAEDTASAAFAGQHDTFLNVEGADEVVAKVKECWLSLWSDRAIAYRRQVGIELTNTSMAVVIQAMVDADVAGVLFTVDPVEGDLKKALIDANFGLGETVVGGETAVDHWQLDKQTGAVTQEVIASKEMHLVSAAGGGTVPVYILSAAERAQASLSSAQREELLQVGMAIEKAYGFPQDIEFAFRNGQLFILQSRPITTIPARWTREESAERFPNPISPLAWDLVEEGFHHSLNYSFDLMGLPAFEGKWFAMFDSYIYGNQNAVELYANGVPLSITSIDDLKKAIPLIAQKYGWVQELPARWARDLDWYLLRLGEFNAMPLGNLSLKELWAHVLDVSDTGSKYFLPNIAISITQRVLYKVLHALLAMMAGPAAAPQLFDALLAHCDTKTGAINAELYHLAKLLQTESDFFDAFDNAHILRVWDTTVAERLPEFREAFERLLIQHGHRETEFDPYMPTWLESPDVVLATLRVMAQGELKNPHENERQLKIRMQETLFSLQQQVPADLRYFFTEVVRLAQTYTSLDDLEHYQTTRLTLPMRRSVRELGNRLVDLGIVEEAMDVFFARQATLNSAITEPNTAKWASLADEITSNKATYTAARKVTPKWALAETEEGVTDSEDGWKGIAGSPGKATGAVFLVHGTEDFGKFPKGAILVARTTNPAWTPLFYGASAVITESGGPLSHGAVTAREMRKPAVMGVRGIMGSLKNGDIVDVDGSRGTVKLVQADDGASDEPK